MCGICNTMLIAYRVNLNDTASGLSTQITSFDINYFI